MGTKRSREMDNALKNSINYNQTYIYIYIHTVYTLKSNFENLVTLLISLLVLVFFSLGQLVNKLCCSMSILVATSTVVQLWQNGHI